MAPIRIGFIGLSAAGGWAAGAHMPYLRTSTQYEIVALCNSSLDSAKAAIKHFDLPSSTKVYDSAAELADDPDVDLVVCSVRVDGHYELIKPAVEKGKACFVEWPLGANLREAEELQALAHAKGIKTMVGLQARRSPVVNKVKELVENGVIGKVLSSTVVSSAGNFGAKEPRSLRYFNEKGVGGNMVSIHFGHLIDYVLFALGELSTFSSLLSIQHPQIQLTSPDSTETETMMRTTPDQIMLQGTLQSGAVLSIHQRGGTPFKDTPGLLWRIYGQTGEIQVTAAGSFLQVGYPGMEIRVYDFTSDSVEVVEWSVDEAAKNLPGPAQNVARLYEAFADGRTQDYADWGEALKRHKLLDELYKSSEESRMGNYMEWVGAEVRE